MSLKAQLMDDLKDAMRSGDELKKTTIRMLRAAIRNAEIARTSSILDALDAGKPSDKVGLTKDDPAYAAALKHRNAAKAYEAEATAHDKHGQEQDQGALNLASQARSEVGRIVEGMSEFDDKAVVDVLRKELKQRQESAEIYERAGRRELAAREEAEAVFIETYLPKQLSGEDIEVEVRSIIAEVGAAGPKDLSRVMPVAMSRLKGRADGRLVNQTVTRVLAEA